MGQWLALSLGILGNQVSSETLNWFLILKNLHWALCNAQVSAKLSYQELVMKKILILIFLSLSISAFAEMDDISVTEACKMELSKEFSADKVEQLLATAEEERQLAEIAFVLHMDSISCFVFYNSSGDFDSASLSIDK